MKTELQKFGAELKGIRLELGLSQSTVAKKCGFKTAQCISNWERGSVFVPPRAAKKLAKLYKIDGKYFADVYGDLGVISYLKRMKGGAK